VVRDYDELTYAEAKQRALRQMGDGYGDALILQDDQGYWALYYFYWSQEPPASAVPHWMEGPAADPAAFRTPYEAKRWLEENGYESFQNDLD
jgi:hypothetical protein